VGGSGDTTAAGTMAIGGAVTGGGSQGGTMTGGANQGGMSEGGMSEGGTSEGGQTAEVPHEPVPVVCSGSEPSLVDGLNPSTAVDYLAIYEGSQVNFDQPPTIRLIEEHGQACAAATAQDACRQALSNAATKIPTPNFQVVSQIVVRRFYVYTRKDEVATIGSKEQLLDFLGPIDTPNEAAAVMWVAQRPASCDGMFATANGYGARSSYMVSDCPISTQTVEVEVAHDGSMSETKVGPPVQTQSCVGRRPSGLHCATPRLEPGDVGAYFAEVAQLELAAVAAFEILERELETHGAPARLLELCRKARADELRHTTAMTELALSFGAAPAPIRVAMRGARTLLEIALENTREGTVRELYGAAVAALQARQAESAEVRSVFERIASDEAEHAWLSAELDAWLMSKLTDEQRELVEAERSRAYAELARELEQPVADSLVRIAGVPRPSQALALLESVRGELMAA
jgi:bacterioferritin (cytochrome b1)